MWKKFLCKFKRLNVKQHRSWWDDEPSHLDQRYMQKPIIIAGGSERVKEGVKRANLDWAKNN